MLKFNLNKFRSDAKKLVNGKHNPSLITKYFSHLSPNDLKLNQAQLIIAREAGFKSWRSLVNSFSEIDQLKKDDGKIYIIEFGLNLVPLVMNSDFLRRISMLRVQLHTEHKMKISPIKVRDNMDCDLDEIRLLVDDEVLWKMNVTNLGELSNSIKINKIFELQIIPEIKSILISNY